MPFGAGGLIRPHMSELALLHRAMDAAVIAFSLYLSTQIYGVEWTAHYTFAAILSVGLFFVFAETRNLYTSWRLGSIRREAVNLLFVLLAVMAGLVALAFLTKTSDAISRMVAAIWFGVTLACLVFERVLLRAALRETRKRGHNTRTLAVAGSGVLAQKVVAKAMETPWLFLRGTSLDELPQFINVLQGHM